MFLWASQRTARKYHRATSAWTLRHRDRDHHVTGFPEFEQFCIAGFPRALKFALKVLMVLTISVLTSLLPAIRAARVERMQALRDE